MSVADHRARVAWDDERGRVMDNQIRYKHTVYTCISCATIEVPARVGECVRVCVRVCVHVCVRV